MARSPRRPTAADILLQAFGRLTPRQQQIVMLIGVVLSLIVAIIYLYEKSHAPPLAGPVFQTPVGVEDQLALGNPSGATVDPGNRDNYLMPKPFFALSYNDSRGEPNWVSWQVRIADISGTSPRKQVFDTDNTLPPGFTAITHRDYSGGGFDRGHMCPHSDRVGAKDSSDATFVMTNIIPQAPEVNQRAWANLEDYGRDLVRRGNDLFVIAGPLGQGGIGTNGPAMTIARGRVVVPSDCWKIIVVVPTGGGVSASSRVISVLMPNRQGLGDDWRPFICTPADIERRTGYHFFGRLPPAVAAALRAKSDGGDQ